MDSINEFGYFEGVLKVFPTKTNQVHEQIQNKLHF